MHHFPQMCSRWTCRGSHTHDIEDAVRPYRDPNIPPHFMNLGMVELGWLNDLYSKILHGRWSAFVLAMVSVICVATFIFWIPIAIIAAIDELSVTNVDGFGDTLALAFSTLMNIQSPYVPTSAAAVLAISIETGFGRLILAGVTAVLVVKASRVQNNILLSKRILFHKQKGFWFVSFRVGCLYGQRLFGSHVQLSALLPGEKKMVSLPLYDSLSQGYFEIGGVPRNVRHLINEQSPLYPLLGKLENGEDIEADLRCLFVDIFGFDELTGRAVGKKRYYIVSDKQHVLVNRQAYMKDVLVPRQKLVGAIRRGSVFSTAAESERTLLASGMMKKLKKSPHVKIGIYWPNFNLFKRNNDAMAAELIIRDLHQGDDEDDEEIEPIHGSEDGDVSLSADGLTTSEH